MRFNRLEAAALSAVVAVAVTLPAQASTLLLGTGWPAGVLYDVNTITGAATNPRPTGISRLVGITAGDDGFLYGMSGSTRELHRIDPITGDSEVIGDLGPFGSAEGDLDFDPITGLLYTAARGMKSPGAALGLMSFDPGTGETRQVGAFPTGGDPSAVAFDAAGNLYVLDTALDRLLLVDPVAGAIRSFVPLSIRLGAVAGMDFSPGTGVLYVADGHRGGTDSLYTLDPATGELELVGQTGLPNGLAGLQFVPEPASVAFFALGSMLLLGRRGGRRVTH